MGEDAGGQNVAALHRKFVIKTGAERLAPRGHRFGAIGRFGRFGPADAETARRALAIFAIAALIVVDRLLDEDLLLTIILGIEHHLALRRQKQERTDMSLQLFGEYRRAVLDRIGLVDEPVVFLVEQLEIVLGKGVVLHLEFEFGAPLFDFGQTLCLFIGQVRLTQDGAVQAVRRVVRIVAGDWPDPRKASFFADARGLGLHDLAGQSMRDLRIDPAVVPIGEEVAIDLAAGFDVTGLADQDRDRIIRLERLVGDNAADRVGVDVAILIVVPDQELLVLALGRSIGLGHIKRDLAGAERCEDRFSQRRQPQPPLDEATGYAEAFGDGVEITG
ncbi:hypothetical protein D9M73_66460 [compost metagenome]